MASTGALLGGMGGVGKSLFGWNVAASVAAGEVVRLVRKPEKPHPVIILSGEDDTHEVIRRVAAYCNGAGLDYAEIGERLLVHPSTDISLQSRKEPERGQQRRHHCQAASG